MNTRDPAPPWLVRTLRSVVVVLVLIGVTAAVLRAVFPDDNVMRFEPIREQGFRALGIEDPFASERAAELAKVDGSFAAHPLATYLHVLFGALFLVFAPLQFSSRIRSRWIRVHRWSGRVLLPTALVAVASGLYFGVLMPYGGLGEAILIALMGGLFLVAASRAFIAIRRRQVARHREWMIRTFAILLAISTVRVVATVFDLTLTPAGFRPPVVFVLSLWTGWAITMVVAEVWIRRTRSTTPVRVSAPARSAAASRSRPPESPSRSGFSGAP